jgi:hypothetical protein
MRRSALAAAVLAAVFVAPVSGAVAMTGAPRALGAATQAIDPIERAGCWRNGWHGWGWYEWCGPRHHEVWEHEVWEPGCRDITIREHHFGGTEVRHIHRCD